MGHSYVFRSGPFTLCGYFFGNLANLICFSKNLIVNALFRQTVKDINTAKQVEVLSQFSNNVCVNRQSLCFGFYYRTKERTDDRRIVGSISFQNVHDIVGTFTHKFREFPRVRTLLVICKTANPPQSG